MLKTIRYKIAYYFVKKAEKQLSRGETFKSIVNTGRAVMAIPGSDLVEFLEFVKTRFML